LPIPSSIVIPIFLLVPIAAITDYNDKSFERYRSQSSACALLDFCYL